MRDPEPLGRRILALLERAPRPIKRGELSWRADAPGKSKASRERRVREAVDWLVMQGYPVLSDGVQGFRLAGNRTEWEQSIRRRHRAVLSEALKLRRLRQMMGRMSYFVPVQQDLFGVAS